MVKQWIYISSKLILPMWIPLSHFSYYSIDSRGKVPFPITVTFIYLFIIPEISETAERILSSVLAKITKNMS